jgi:hypothetical protein
VLLAVLAFLLSQFTFANIKLVPLKAVQLGAADISDISRKQANVEKRAAC